METPAPKVELQVISARLLHRIFHFKLSIAVYIVILLPLTVRRTAREPYLPFVRRLSLALSVFPLLLHNLLTCLSSCRIRDYPARASHRNLPSVRLALAICHGKQKYANIWKVRTLTGTTHVVPQPRADSWHKKCYVILSPPVFGGISSCMKKEYRRILIERGQEDDR